MYEVLISLKCKEPTDVLHLICSEAFEGFCDLLAKPTNSFLCSVTPINSVHLQSMQGHSETSLLQKQWPKFSEVCHIKNAKESKWKLGKNLHSLHNSRFASSFKTLVKTVKLLESLVRYMCVSHPRDLYLKKWLWLQDIFQIAIPIQVMIVFVL